MTLNVVDFGVSASPTAISLSQDHSATSTITVSSLNGFSGNVALSANAPAGFTVALNPTTVSLTPGGTATSTLTITATGSQISGTYTVTVTGSSGTLSHQTAVSVSYTVGGNLLSNPGFETGSFASWSQTGMIIRGDAGSMHSGLYGAAPAYNPSTQIYSAFTLQQNLPSAVAGSSITKIQLWYRWGTSADSVQVLYTDGTYTQTNLPFVGSWTLVNAAFDSSKTISGVKVVRTSGQYTNLNLDDFALQANLLSNPGFETGNFNGWSQTGMIIRADSGSMHSGLYGAAPAYNSGTQIYSAFTLQQNLLSPVAGSSITKIQLWYRWGTSADSVQVLYTDGTYTQTNLPFVGSWTLVNAAFDSSKTISGVKVVRTSGQYTNLNLDDFALQANLLSNPGFETCNFNGWSQTGMIIRADSGSMHSGLYGAAPAYNSGTQIYSAFTLQQNLLSPVAGSSITKIQLWYRWGTSADSVQVLYTDGTYTQTNLPFVGSWTLVNAAFDSSKTISGVKVVRTSGQYTNLNLDDFALQANLLSNPGFETGNFNGWSQTGMIIRADSGSMHSGLYGAAPAYNSGTQIYSAFTLQQNLLSPVAGSSITKIQLWYRWGTSADSVQVLYTDGTYTQTNLPFVGSWTLVNAAFDSSKTISGVKVVRTSGQYTNLNLDDFALQANLLSNPGFETGNFNGWSQTGMIIRADSGSMHSGLYGAAPAYNSGTQIYSAFTLQQNLLSPVAGSSITKIQLWYRWGTSADSVQVLYTDGTYTQTNLPFVGSWTLVNAAFDSSKTISGVKVVRTSGQYTNLNLDDFALQANLLSNPGFETGNFNGWSQTGMIIRADSGSMHSGLYGAAPA